MSRSGQCFTLRLFVAVCTGGEYTGSQSFQCIYQYATLMSCSNDKSIVVLTKADRKATWTGVRLLGSWTILHNEAILAELITGNISLTQTAAIEQC